MHKEKILKRIPSTQSMASLHELRVAQLPDAPEDQADNIHNLEYEVTLVSVKIHLF